MVDVILLDFVGFCIVECYIEMYLWIYCKMLMGWLVIVVDCGIDEYCS